MHKNIYLIVFILFALCNPFLYAKNNSIVLTHTSIQSLEGICPTKQSVVLHCRSYGQTTEFTCGPVAVMILMNYYGLLNGGSMNKQTELRIANEMGSSSQMGTSAAQVAEWLRGHGFNVESGSHVTTDMIIDNINKRNPMIVAINNHWLLAKGYRKGSTPKDDEIIFADSVVITRDTLDSMWRSSGKITPFCGNNLGLYIIATKR